MTRLESKGYEAGRKSYAPNYMILGTKIAEDGRYEIKRMMTKEERAEYDQGYTAGFSGRSARAIDNHLRWSSE